MTTFLLHGGATSKKCPENDRFFAQFTRLINKPKFKISLCYWARTPDKWNSVSKRDINQILAFSDKSIDFYIPPTPRDLLNQIDDSDVIYVAGGDAEPIEPLFPDLVFLKTKLKGKVFAGSSMGAFLACQNYVLSFDSQDDSSLHHGLGLLPIQILCHWDLEDRKDFKLSLLEKDKLTLVLEEGEFVTIYHE